MSSLIPYDDAVALLEGANLGFPIAYPNLPFKPPTTSLWLAFSMTSDSIDMIELNGGAWQEEGVVQVLVIVPTATGSRQARLVAKQVSDIYRNLGPRNVVYYSGSIGESSQDVPNGNFWAMGVTVNYRYQDTPNPAPA